MDDYYDNCCYCIVCGAPIPEGRLICPICENDIIKKESEKKDDYDK